MAENQKLNWLDLLKKNWFVVLVALCFMGTAIFFAYDQNKDKVPGKTSNGSGVLFSLDGKDFTADELYERLYATGGEDAAYMLLQRQLLDVCVSETDDMKTEAQELADNYLAYYQTYLGTSAEAYIASALKSIGLDTLYDYCLYNVKLEKMLQEYVTENADSLWGDFAADYTPRMVSHVLVKMDDPDNPTAEETARFEEVKAAWEKGDLSFADFAQQYSDDTSSAVKGGSVGYCDKDTSFVTGFKETALALKVGEISEWTKSQYGYHLITVTSDDRAELMADSSCLESILNFYPSLEDEIMLKKLEENNVSFSTTELEEAIRKALTTTVEEDKD